ncbi:MAG: STAS domain-containing protein [Bacteroidales bacterium]|jgi:anti-sigma B factor antagonist|nr:STAS domain-containing protein [Bacteroidales bacterium]MDY0197544.1 STAS domain-containing protein [Tenuifilaceae bacterium]
MINIEKINDVLIVSMETENKLNVALAQKFKVEVAKIIDQPEMKIVINLGGVVYIDSTGFGALLSILRVAKSNNAKLKLCNISPEVMELVKLLQLQTVFDIRNSVDDCLKSF